MEGAQGTPIESDTELSHTHESAFSSHRVLSALKEHNKISVDMP